MSIVNSVGVSAATSALQSPTAGTVEILVMKKALDAQATNAAALLQAIPQPALATEGSVGRNVNTFA